MNLQSDGHKKDYETIDSLIDEGFGFYMDPGIEDMMKYARFYKRFEELKTVSNDFNLFKKLFSKKQFNSNQYENYKKNTLDPYSKDALVSSYDEILHLNQHHQKNFSFNVCNEIILTVPVVFYIQKNSYLTEVLNEKIDDLKSAGLIDYWISKYLDPKYLKFKKSEQGPRKLNFNELSGAFQLLAFGSVVAATAFVIEHCFSCMKK